MFYPFSIGPNRKLLYKNQIPTALRSLPNIHFSRFHRKNRPLTALKPCDYAVKVLSLHRKGETITM